MDDYIQEKYIEKSPNPITIDGTENILFQMKNCICKIINNDGKKGTGFFCRIPYKDKLLTVLITNYHILNENIYKKKAKIELTINDGKKAIILNLDNSRIKLTNKNLDITIIEIKSKIDKINHFLDIDENINTDLEYIYNHKSIYILHYPKGTLANVSYGLSNKIIDHTYNHYCNTEEGSSGAPMLLLDSFKVIGMHRGVPKNSNYQFNLGTFIKPAIDLFNIEADINNYSFNIKTEEYQNNSINYINKSNSNTYLTAVKNITQFENPIFKEGIISTSEIHQPFNQGAENLQLANYYEPNEVKYSLEEGLINKGYRMDSKGFLRKTIINREISEGNIVRPPIFKNRRLNTIDEGTKVLPVVYGGLKVSGKREIENNEFAFG